MDGPKSSVITDHPFEPRTRVVPIAGWFPAQWLPPNPHLCGYEGCNLAESAHRETTVCR